MIDEFKAIKTDNRDIKIHYIDYDMTSFGVVVRSMDVSLIKRDKNTNLKKLTADFLKKNVKEHDLFSNFQIDNTDDLVKKIGNKIQMVKNFIAVDGRIGQATDLVLNSYTHSLYSESILDINIIINDYVDDDVFYIIRNNEVQDVGYKFYYFESVTDLYFDIIKVGSAEKQAYKFVLNSNRKKRKIKLDKIKSKHDQKPLD